MLLAQLRRSFDADMQQMHRLARRGRLRALTEGKEFGRPRTWKREQAKHVRELVAQGLSHRQVAAKVGLSASSVRRILQQGAAL